MEEVLKNVKIQLISSNTTEETKKIIKKSRNNKFITEIINLLMRNLILINS